MEQVVIVVGVGFACLVLGVWLHRRLRASADEYQRGGRTSGERVARDMTTGRALMHAWVLVVLGAAGIVYGLVMLARQAAQ